MNGNVCHWMDIGIEDSWNTDDTRLWPVLQSEFDTKIYDSELLALIWAKPDDLVVLRNAPDPLFLAYLQSKGIVLPHIHALNQDVEVIDERALPPLARLVKQNCLKLRPYVVTQQAHEWSKRESIDLIGGDWRAVVEANNKISQEKLLRQAGVPVPEGRIFSSCQSCIDYLEHVGDAAIGQVVKTPFGASSKALYRVDHREKVEQLVYLLKKRSKKRNDSLQILLQKWYSTRKSISYKLSIDNTGKGQAEFVKEQLLVNGVYRGFVYSRDIDQEYRLKLSGFSRDIASALYSCGVRDVANIDAIETTSGVLYPAIDINVRFSLAMYFEHRISRFPDYKSLYFDVPWKNSLESVLSGSNDILNRTGGDVLVASVSRPDRHGVARVFVLFGGNDIDHVEAIQNRWCDMLSIPGNERLLKV